MVKPSKAITYLILFFSAINAITFSVAQFLIAKFSFTFNYSLVLIVGLSIISAIIISLIIVTSAPIFKEYMATYRRLLRLDNLSHPLILKLAEEAPGTYYHSLAVANLSYRVAKELELNAILVRVGAYFHDIGKLNNPNFFIENQQGNNPHDKLTNLKSAQIIKLHISEGIDLAEEANLPSEVINFIPEHAGTTLISYFYDKAEQAGEKPKKSDYRYVGPKPKSLETAIVMIADSLEAKIRLLSEINKNTISQTIDEVIEDKISQNQFSFINLEEKSMNLLKAAFLKAAQAQFHQRIDYPKEKTIKKLIKRKTK